MKREARVKLSGQDGHLEHIDLSPQPANIKNSTSISKISHMRTLLVGRIEEAELCTREEGKRR